MVLIDKIKAKIKGSCVIGLHVDFTEGGKVEYHMVKLKRINNSLSHEDANSLRSEEFSELNIQRLPVVLCFSGSNVIIKKVEEADADIMLKNLIPQGKSEEFFYDISPAGKGYKWLSVIRKDDVNKILGELKDNKMFLAGVSIGPFDVLPLLSGIEGYEDNIKSGRYRLDLVKGADSGVCSINDFNIDSTEERIYRIGGEEISSIYLAAYAAAVTFFTNKETIWIDGEIKAEIQEYSYSRSFKALYSGLGILLFVLLMVNFIVFSSYRDKYQQLSCDVRVNRSLLAKQEALRDEVKRYKSTISRNSLDKNSNMSVLCDRLIMKMPDGIKLKNLSVYPLVSKKREGKPLKYKDGIIHIEGVCKDPKSIDYWLRYLKDEDWLSGVNRQEYFEREGQGMFVLELKILSKE